MRRSRRTLTALALGASALALAALAAWALAAGGGPAVRRTGLTLRPAPDDLALAQVAFAGSSGRTIPARSLRVAVSGPFGDDYLAWAATRAAVGGGRALVLLVNRPSPLMDPASVSLSLSAWRSLGRPTVRTLTDALSRSGAAAARRPALCDLRLHGAPLRAAQLHALGSRGAALGGFSVAQALAQAYDLACGLPYAGGFAQAVQHPSGASPPPSASSPSPSEPAPSPSPPVGKLPGEGCVPRPGYACPLAAAARRSDGRASAAARRAPAGAH